MVKKKSILILILALCVSFSLVAAGQSESGRGTAQKKDFKFYGKVAEFPTFEKMTAVLQAQYEDKYDFEFIQVDWGNLEQVVRTGIASGDPCDIYAYWPMQLRSFVDSNMILDLTPYLEANDGEWKKTFTLGHLDMGKYDGKYYGVPYHANYSVFYVNKDVFDAAGVEIPKTWTWDEFLDICEIIKTKTGVTPLAFPGGDLAHWMFTNGIESIMKEKGVLDEFANGNIDYTTLEPEFKEVFANLKALFADYTYPKKGSVTLKRDEAKAAFFQGKAAIIAEVAVFAKMLSNGATDFNMAVAPWPTMGADLATGGSDGFMIPANVKDPDAAVEVLKAFLSPEIMKIHADGGYPVSFPDLEISDPVIKTIVELGGNVYSNNYFAFSPKLQEYAKKNMLAELVLGAATEDEIIQKMEGFRAESKK
jgi:ABC-type glycerol-3-phosphate transport system substrate-binding protein